MKDFLKAFLGTALILSIIVCIGLSKLDQPSQNCHEYIEQNNLSQDVCK